MEEKTRLRFLLKGDSYRVVRQLKSYKIKPSYRRLRKKLKISTDKLTSILTGLHPYVVQEGNRISLPEDCDFVLVGDMSYAYYIRKRLKQMNK